MFYFGLSLQGNAETDGSSFDCNKVPTLSEAINFPNIANLCRYIDVKESNKANDILVAYIDQLNGSYLSDQAWVQRNMGDRFKPIGVRDICGVFSHIGQVGKWELLFIIGGDIELRGNYIVGEVRTLCGKKVECINFAQIGAL